LKEKVKEEKPKKHFIRSSTAVPYINLFESTPHSPAKLLPIKRIIIGPHQEKEKRKRQLKFFSTSLAFLLRFQYQKFLI
jgi:hypothetical protein